MQICRQSADHFGQQLLQQYQMLIKTLFAIYLIFLFLYTFLTALNYSRIQAKGWIHPQVVVFLFPFVVNFLMAKLVFGHINPLLTTLVPCLMMYLIGDKIKKLRIIGLTGGIACGKSTLVKMMTDNIGSELAIIDCDRINTELRNKGRPGHALILELLKKHGQDTTQYINGYSGEIKREVLSKYSFEHPHFLRQLGHKLSKYIFWQIVKQIFTQASAKKKLILIDAPLLYESKVLQHICFPVIVIGSDEALQVQRLVKTRNLTEQEARLRIKSQMPLSQKKRLSDIYVDNNGSPEQMFGRTLKFLNKMLSETKK